MKAWDPWTPGVPTGAGRGARFFADRAGLRSWFETNHKTARELWIGYWKAGSGRSGVGYAEAVEEALCFGWIDGQVRSLGVRSYANRYSPRRPGSRWSQANIATARRLLDTGRMHPAGLEAFRAREAGRRAGDSFEEPIRPLGRKLASEFRSHPGAWSFFERQPPHYRRMAIFWVMSARRETTRWSRLEQLVGTSSRHRRLERFVPRPTPK